MNTQEKITAIIDDKIFDIKKEVQKKFKLSWAKARDMTNKAIRELMC